MATKLILIPSRKPQSNMHLEQINTQLISPKLATRASCPGLLQTSPRPVKFGTKSTAPSTVPPPNTLGTRPLVVLHGGPGLTSAYVLPLSNLTTTLSLPVIIYDQLGNGRSTHLPDKLHDTTFWSEDLFLLELKLLLEHLGIYDNYDLFGNSWGGMLAARHAANQPGGLKKLIIMSAPASLDLWMANQSVLRSNLPQEIQETLLRCEKEGKTDSTEYQEGIKVYSGRHLCTVDPMPEELKESFVAAMGDPTVYHTMYGPNRFNVTGTLKTWSIIDDLPKINVPTLLTNGATDEASDSCVSPYFKLIPRVKWVHFAKSSHMAHFEEPKKFYSVLGSFLIDDD
ncbi:hypothetical protein NP233_g8882 [Leucocoprinus birnbaumii]|uniref:AB hydrolase-1 domain-containing protein n=1 Tax=Leucocoprinus birnbaumii TaxID=56174 RepID=A0AAD5VLE8_9AGAR|nr:hypothetical protein NP233_g8882 [Leucocoprinus birnbaumii]